MAGERETLKRQGLCCLIPFMWQETEIFWSQIIDGSKHTYPHRHQLADHKMSHPFSFLLLFLTVPQPWSLTQMCSLPTLTSVIQPQGTIASSPSSYTCHSPSGANKRSIMDPINGVLTFHRHSAHPSVLSVCCCNSKVEWLSGCQPRRKPSPPTTQHPGYPSSLPAQSKPAVASGTKWRPLSYGM